MTVGNAHRRARPRVLLFTETFPALGPHEPFIAVEVQHLAGAIDLVLIPTTRIQGPTVSLPAGVEVEGGLADYMAGVRGRLAGLVKSAVSPETYREIFRFGARACDPRVVAAVIVRGARMHMARTWTRRYLKSAGPVVAYSWWASAVGYGIARASQDVGVPCISRIHGYELYPEQDRLGRIPFQAPGLRQFDAVYPVSTAGAEFLKDAYPVLEPRIKVAYLGVEDYSVRKGPSIDGVFRIVSCSSCIPLKRVELLAMSMSCLLRDHPEITFTWTHIGDGPTLPDVKRLVEAEPHLAERCIFTGFLPQGAGPVLAEQHCDVFLNVSTSEGLPVTLMEAACCGIPLIATAVGGNAEIVDETCGLLLRPNPDPEEVAAAIASIARLSTDDRNRLRVGSRDRWSDKFSAEQNYRAFGDLLVTLGSR